MADYPPLVAARAVALDDPTPATRALYDLAWHMIATHDRTAVVGTMPIGPSAPFNHELNDPAACAAAGWRIVNRIAAGRHADR